MMLSHKAPYLSGNILFFFRIHFGFQQLIQLFRLFRIHLTVDLFLLLFLHRTAVRCKHCIILIESLHRESIIAYHSQRIKHLAKPCRMSPSRSSHRIYQLIRNDPSGRKNFPDRLFGFRSHLQRCLKMRLNDKLLHTNSRSLLLKLT